MNYAIITAGGKGKRFQSSVSKQLIPIKGKALLCWALKPFQTEKWIDQVVLVHPSDEKEETYLALLEQEGFGKIRLVPGGNSRFESVHHGFSAIGEASPEDIVVIHDAARPVLSPALLKSVLETAAEKGAAIPAMAVSETLKEVSQHQVVQTVSREHLFAAQTPQAFRYGILKKAYQESGSKTHWTDEAMLVEHAGFVVSIVPGEKRNIKVTEPEDLLLAEFYLEQGWK